MRPSIVAVPTIAFLWTVMLVSIPAQGLPPGVTCGKRMVVTTTGTTKSKARKACYRKLQDRGRELYGSAYWGLSKPSSWCDEDAPNEWFCVCSGDPCRWRTFNIEPFDESIRIRPFSLPVPGRQPSGRPSSPGSRRR